MPRRMPFKMEPRLEATEPHAIQDVFPGWVLDTRLAFTRVIARPRSLVMVRYIASASRQRATVTASAFLGTNPTDELITSGLPVTRTESERHQ